MNLEIVPLLPAHIDMMEYRKSDRPALDYFHELLHHPEDKYRAWAILNEEGNPVALGGFAFPWPKVADAFMTFSQEVENNHELAMAIFWRMKKIAKMAFDQYDLHRIEATAPYDKTDRARWLKNIGFKQEGCLKKYGPDGQDYVMFGMVK
jgi:hypothetical protein